MARSRNLLHTSLTLLIASNAGFWGFASAHTDVTDNITEGRSGFNSLAIEHGCSNPATGRNLPVIAQSVVFPGSNPRVTRSDGSTSPGLSAEIVAGSGLAGLATPVQDKSIFRKQRAIKDANSNTIGFSGTGGSLAADLMGQVPFHLTAIRFQSTSCAKTLTVQIAVADICTRVFPPKPGTANLWIPAATSKFKGTGVEGFGAPALLTVNRDLDSNPLPVHCGGGYDVTVAPTEDEVDAYLPIKGYWGR